jgi:hypothetical protein
LEPEISEQEQEMQPEIAEEEEKDPDTQIAGSTL